MVAFNQSNTLNTALGELVAAFADDLRRQIYYLLRSEGPLNINQVSKHFKLPPNVVRYHLEKLVEFGYLKASNQLTKAPGRPAKVFTVTSRSMLIYINALKDDLLKMLLMAFVEVLGVDLANSVAERIGFELGKNLVKNCQSSNLDMTLDEALKIVANTLCSHGFVTEIKHEDRPELVTRNCPFGEVENINPILCTIEKGVITGMLGNVLHKRVSIKFSSRAKGDLVCSSAT